VAFDGPIDSAIEDSIVDAIAGDVDGDGKPDVVTIDLAADVTVLPDRTPTSSGSGVLFSGITDIPVDPSTAYALALADFGSAAGPDILLAGGGSAAQELSILANRTTPGLVWFANEVTMPTQQPGPGTAIAVADFNLDGIPDVAIPNFDGVGVFAMRR
jgi:hypothetical protein